MRIRRPVPLALVTLAAAAATAVPTSASAAAQFAPAAPAPLGREGAPANGADRNHLAAGAVVRAEPRAATTAARTSADAAYPRRTQLRTYPVDPADASIKLGAIPYHEIGPRLNALQAASDRVSVEVIGQSTQGRDLYLLTVTAPETEQQVARQAELRALIEDDPAAAAADPELAAEYKAPVLVNGNIHGNEWEGTDGILRVAEELATSTDPQVGRFLDTARFYAVVSVNPDGRVAGTRRNAAGFDMNRDYITASQPETVASRDVIVDTQPLVFLDQHGYVGGTLLEPTTAPHGQNYEYDLYIRQALANALAMEAEIEATPVPEALPGEVDPVIPFRDYEPGDWDDWPPIFTPMYAMFHGSVGHTVEFPLRVNGSAYTTLPVEELQRRARINTEVVARTIRAALRYTDANRASLVADQIEIFRRGSAGEQREEVPLDFVPGFGPEDQGYLTEFPRAYVIPGISEQRSPAAAARLVDHLVANDVRVTRVDRAFRVGGTRYPIGSYLVDMHQPKRGLANVMLEAGRDISERVPQMYDISGWSHRLLWGATAQIVLEGDLPAGGTPVVAAGPTGSVVRGARQTLRLDVQDPKDALAVNALLDLGVTVGRAADGSVTVPASARKLARQVAQQYGVRFTSAPSGPTVPLEDLTIAAAAASDELKALTDMGFEVVPVSNPTLDAGFDWTGVDVLFVSSGLTYSTLGAPARAALDAFLADGGVVTRGSTGAAFNAEAGLLTATAVLGRSDANGVVDVTNSGGPVTAGALGESFVYSPVWFTGLGAEVTAEQTYAGTGTPIVAGHWLPAEDGSGGPADAVGQASVVRGLDEDGTSVVMFGTEPMFRDHPKGLYSQVARALFYTDATAR